jgi:N-acetylglucosamine malate deacetylase 2
MKYIFPLFILLFAMACASQKPDYNSLGRCQDNTVPELDLRVPENSKVLAIFPHADDEVVAAGLIQYFRERGAVVHLFTLDRFTDARVTEQVCCAQTLGIEKVESAGLINNSWEDILQNKIVFWNDHQDSIKRIISSKISEFRPDILLTYDKETGGYGHPEHWISAKLTDELFSEYRNDPSFSPTILFQITLPDKLEAYLFQNSKAYLLARELNSSNGLPAPDVAVSMQKYWDLKNKAGQCFVSQRNTLKKFHLVFEETYRQEHINALSREYYVLIRR